MSMVDNYEASVNALKRFILANHPGMTERSISNVESSNQYFSLEFRDGSMGVSLYIELDGFSAETFHDEEGNRWRKYGLTVKPSWASYGTVDLEDSVKFARLLVAVNAFAASIQAAFKEPFVRMSATAAEIAESKQKAALDKCRSDVASLMRANIKGMKVGQERRVEVPGGAPDLLPVGEVACWDGKRKYTTHVTATRAFYMMRVD